MRRRLPAAVLALALAAAAGCSDSPCQELGERLCACSGLDGDDCTAQVEGQLRSGDPGDARCEALLSSCAAPGNAVFCEWLLTEDGKTRCGFAPPDPAPSP